MNVGYVSEIVQLQESAAFGRGVVRGLLLQPIPTPYFCVVNISVWAQQSGSNERVVFHNGAT